MYVQIFSTCTVHVRCHDIDCTCTAGAIVFLSGFLKSKMWQLKYTPTSLFSAETRLLSVCSRCCMFFRKEKTVGTASGFSFFTLGL